TGATGSLPVNSFSARKIGDQVVGPLPTTVPPVLTPGAWDDDTSVYYDTGGIGPLGLFNTDTGIFTAPVTGRYSVTSNLAFLNTETFPIVVTVRFLVNGTSRKESY